MNLSSRIDTLPASPIRKLIPYAQKAKSEGVTVYHLNIGDPDIKTPPQMLEVLKDWNIETISYALSQGDPEFIAALEWYYHTLGYSYLSSKNIQVSSGGSEAISMALFATCNPGEKVIVFEPFYANYKSFAVLNGVEFTSVPTSAENGFHLPSRQVLETYITPQTKAILFCNPSNPTGTVYTKQEIEMLVDLAKKYNLFLLSDEVYREFVYDGHKQISLLDYMPKIPDRAVVLDSMSKRYSLCGSRLGVFVSLNEQLMTGALKIGQSRLSSGFIEQKMAAKLKDVPESYTQAVQKEYETRRDVIFEGLRTIPGIKIPKPEGAFYTIVTLPVDDSDTFCQWLLTDFRDQNETVMLAPASGFYGTEGLGKHEVRLAYVIEVPKLQRCVEILKKALEVYNQSH